VLSAFSLAESTAIDNHDASVVQHVFTEFQVGFNRFFETLYHELVGELHLREGLHGALRDLGVDALQRV